MSKAVLISIQPKWCDLIVLGAKSLEIRKTKPKLETPFKCYIYCTKSQKGWFNFRTKERIDGKVIGEFVCNDIETIDVPYPAYSDKLDKRIIEQSKVPYSALHRYAYHDAIYGWHISELKIYDEPKMLHHFFEPCGDCDKKGTIRCTEELSYCRAKVISRAPQSWCYVEEEE